MQWKEPKGGGAVKWMGGRLVVSEEEGGKGESVSRLPTIFTPRSPLPAARAPHFDSSFGEEAFFPALSTPAPLSMPDPEQRLEKRKEVQRG